MAKANGALSLLTAEATFLDRFNTNQEQSKAKIQLPQKGVNYQAI